MSDNYWLTRAYTGATTQIDASKDRQYGRWDRRIEPIKKAEAAIRFGVIDEEIFKKHLLFTCYASLAIALIGVILTLRRK